MHDTSSHVQLIQEVGLCLVSTVLLRCLYTEMIFTLVPLSPIYRCNLLRIQQKSITFSSKSNQFRNVVHRREGRLHVAMAEQMVLHDFGVTAAVVGGAYLWVQAFELLTRFKLLDQKLSRKLVHITTGPLYMLCWPFFSSSYFARYIAALVPTANAIRLLILGLGFQKNEGVVKSMSRAGDPRELLKGPLYYVGVLFISTVCFWRESPVGMIALSMMCGGDGVADIIGRKFGGVKLPYNKEKSWAGSIAMFIVGFLLSTVSICYFSSLGFYNLELRGSLLRIAWVSLAATLMESLPITSSLDDNLIVPTTVILLASILFAQSQ